MDVFEPVICPHHNYHFSNAVQKVKLEGTQSRFLSLILGMDPSTMLKATEETVKRFENGTDYEKIHYYSGTREANRYRSVTLVRNVMKIFSFLHVLEMAWDERGNIPPLSMEMSQARKNSSGLLKKFSVDMQMLWKTWLFLKNYRCKSTS